MACLNKVVAGELREFYVEDAAGVGGVSGCLWGGAVGHSSSFKGCIVLPYVRGFTRIGRLRMVSPQIFPCRTLLVRVGRIHPYFWMFM